ncbi:hypothetical protein [uncultured Helicobacter sp.]|uniref:hypothetical protein n=1 Tax=uncultured Helicobacter sp. TaxID=175537 RepID=UPI0037500A29
MASCSLEFSVDSNSESNSTESKQFTQSTTLKTLIKALPIKIYRCASTNRPSPLSWC